jgi:hypothetical protein
MMLYCELNKQTWRNFLSRLAQRCLTLGLRQAIVAILGLGCHEMLGKANPIVFEGDFETLKGTYNVWR